MGDSGAFIFVGTLFETAYIARFRADCNKLRWILAQTATAKASTAQGRTGKRLLNWRTSHCAEPLLSCLKRRCVLLFVPCPHFL